MAVVSVSATWPGRSGNAGGAGENAVTASFLVKTDSKLDTAATILSSGLLPVPYVSTFPGSSFLLCRSVNVTQKTETPYAWDVTADYSDEQLSQEEEEARTEPNPLLREPKVTWDSQQYQKAIWKDINDEAIYNSANDPFDPPPMIDDARWVISVQSNVASVPAYVLTLNNVINDSSVTVDGITFAAQTLKVQGIRIGDVETENGVTFRQFSYQLNFRAETWKMSNLDAGFSMLDSNGDKVEILLPKDKSKPTAPQPLDGSGGLLASPTPANAVYIDSDVYTEADLTVLPGVT